MDFLSVLLRRRALLGAHTRFVPGLLWCHKTPPAPHKGRRGQHIRCLKCRMAAGGREDHTRRRAKRASIGVLRHSPSPGRLHSNRPQVAQGPYPAHPSESCKIPGWPRVAGSRPCKVADGPWHKTRRPKKEGRRRQRDWPPSYGQWGPARVPGLPRQVPRAGAPRKAGAACYSQSHPRFGETVVGTHAPSPAAPVLRNGRSVAGTRTPRGLCDNVERRRVAAMASAWGVQGATRCHPMRIITFTLL